jgi:hypothetical protein
VTAWFLSWPRGEACLAPTRVGVGAGHARPEALRNESDGRGTVPGHYTLVQCPRNTSSSALAGHRKRWPAPAPLFSADARPSGFNDLRGRGQAQACPIWILTTSGPYNRL